MGNLEQENKTLICDQCPKKPGRFCTSYRNGMTRLVFDPLPQPRGKLRYREPYESPESILDCSEREKTIVRVA